ncbi:MAG: Uma2 family endonuclease [Arcicella sp.]|jgi:Uma2 family endonuclease|nr:Uma2 family endonuclease [Arcicella sp.]
MTVSTQPYSPPLKLNRPIRKYTLEQYLEKEAKSVDKHEFIDGQIIKMPYAKGPHNIIAANMMAQLIIQTVSLDKSYTVFASDQKVYFPSLNEGVYADALAVCEKPLYWDDNQLLLINPIVVVEVLSKSTSKYDRAGKFAKYKTLESFKEYVLIRQDECYAEIWYRESPGRWQETIVTDLKGEIPLQAMDIMVSIEQVYRNVELKEK